MVTTGSTTIAHGETVRAGLFIVVLASLVHRVCKELGVRTGISHGNMAIQYRIAVLSHILIKLRYRGYRHTLQVHIFVDSDCKMKLSGRPKNHSWGCKWAIAASKGVFWRCHFVDLCSDLTSVPPNWPTKVFFLRWPTWLKHDKQHIETTLFMFFLEP